MSLNRIAASTGIRRKRLQRDLGGLLGAADRLEDVAVAAQLAVLGQVAAGLAHEPHGRAIHGLAPQRAEESIGAHDPPGYGPRAAEAQASSSPSIAGDASGHDDPRALRRARPRG